jgi:hypothetical protein
MTYRYNVFYAVTGERTSWYYESDVPLRLGELHCYFADCHTGGNRDTCKLIWKDVVVTADISVRKTPVIYEKDAFIAVVWQADDTGTCD